MLRVTYNGSSYKADVTALGTSRKYMWPMAQFVMTLDVL